MSRPILTRDDDWVVKFQIEDNSRNKLDLTGATFVTGWPGDSSQTIANYVEFGSSFHSIVSATTGEFKATLTPTETITVAVVKKPLVYVIVTISGVETTYWGELQVDIKQRKE